MILDLSSRTHDLGDFLGLAARIHREDPTYCATPDAAVRHSLLRECFAGRQLVLLSLAAGAARARVVARLTPVLRDGAGKPYGMLGFFEAFEDEDLVSALLREALGWLRERGAGEIIGPIDGDTWHRYRFNVGPHERPPFLMEPANPPHYPRSWERLGFEPFERYHSRTVADVTPAMQALEPEHERALAAGYVLRPLDRRRLREELLLLYQISIRSFASNALYTEISREDFLALYEGVGSLLDPELVLFAHDPRGEPVAFAFAFLDRFPAVRAMRGKRGPLSKLRFLLARGQVDAVNVKSLAVLPEHRRARLAYALTWRLYRRALELGVRRANLCLIRDGNPSSRLDAGLGSEMRRYILYRYAGMPRG